MPSVTYMNSAGPFWDFVAALEQEGTNHPLFGQNQQNDNERAEGREGQHDAPPSDPFGWGNFFGGRGVPHRGPPPPSRPPPEHHDEEIREKEAEKNNEKDDETMKEANDNGEGPSGRSGSDNEGCAWGRGRHGRCGGPRRRGHCGPGGPDGPNRHHEGPHHGGPHHGPRGFGRRGGWGPWGRGGPLGGGFGGGFGGFDPSHGLDPSALVAQLWNAFNDTHPSNANANANANANKATTDNEDYAPDADIFDTENAYVVHVSLPGAKKEDVGVNWDAEKSELSIAGVVYRPGDEEFLKTLALNERKVGPFDRKIRLGTRASPAHIDVDAITAKLEDGILRVEVPKLDAGYVEIKKVDIE
jgi:HSP20 family protein